MKPAPPSSDREPLVGRSLPRPIFLLHAFLAIVLSALPMHSSHADGGVVLAEHASTIHRVTLFGSPYPLRAGPADLSVFVQDAKTGEPILNAKVEIQLLAASPGDGEAWVPPCCSMKPGDSTLPARRESAQNKLLYAADALFSASGSHRILVQVDGGAALAADVEVSPALPPAAHYWSYLALPPLFIGIFALNQRLRRRSS